MGEFENLDGYTEGPQVNLIVFAFIAAAFFSQITMLNMLIAIMGDVFDYLTERKLVRSIKFRLKILAEQAPILEQINKIEE